MESQHGQEVPATRRPYSEEFKRDALRLVGEEGYSIKAAWRAVGVCDQTLRSWHTKLVPPPETCGEGATVSELQAENKRLRKQLKRAEMEHEMLKKPRRILQRRRSALSLIQTGRLDSRALRRVPDRHPVRRHEGLAIRLLQFGRPGAFSAGGSP